MGGADRATAATIYINCGSKFRGRERSLSLFCRRIKRDLHRFWGACAGYVVWILLKTPGAVIDITAIKQVRFNLMFVSSLCWRLSRREVPKMELQQTYSSILVSAFTNNVVRFVRKGKMCHNRQQLHYLPSQIALPHMTPAIPTSCLYGFHQPFVVNDVKYTPPSQFTLSLKILIKCIYTYCT